MFKSVHYQAVDPGDRWIKDAAVAIDIDSPLDSSRTLTPNVIRMGGGYRMYYHGLGPGGPEGSHGYILSAWSSAAVSWQKDPGIRLEAGGEGAAQIVWSPDVIPMADGGYRMYVEGKTEQADGSFTSAIISAVSDDGLAWEREPGIRLGGASASLGAPRCLYLESGPRYRLYASDFNEHQIVSAISDDGLTFELEAGFRISRERPFEGHEVYAPEVLPLGTGGYRMYYAGWVAAPEVTSGSAFHGRIFSALSVDGVHWVKDDGICVDKGGGWDTNKASEPCVIDLDDGRFRMFYEACDGAGRWRIASATSVAGGE
jgi:hypothetical protein